VIILKQWPTLEAVQNTDDTVLQTFLQAHHAHNPAINQQRMDGIRHAMPATTDQAVIRSSVMVVHALVEHVRCLAEALCELADRPSSGAGGRAATSRRDRSGSAAIPDT
jgi:hypothetical protein